MNCQLNWETEILNKSLKATTNCLENEKETLLGNQSI